MDAADDKTFRRLVRLTSEQERASVRASFQLPSDAKVPVIAEALRRLPRYQALRRIFGLAPDTLTMLREIAAELERLNASARTSTTIVFLDVADGERKEFVLGPQLSKRLAEFHADDLAATSLPVADTATMWATVQRALERLLAQTTVRSGRWRDKSGTGAYTRAPDRFDDPGARLVLRHVAERLERCLPGLVDVSDERGSSVHRVASAFIRKMRDTIDRSRNVDQDEPSRFASWSQDDSLVARDFRRVMRDAGGAFNDLTELALLRARTTNAENTADLLAANLWTTRPQLFEVWVLTRVISIMRVLGYVFEPLEVETTEGGARWQLSYSRATRPCGLFRSAGLGAPVEGYLYYQLHKASGRAMPDIALLAGQSSRSRAIWTMDPKHSDRRAYTLRSYTATADRYLRAFASSRCSIVEHFERADLTDKNPLDLARGAKLIHEVSPSGVGLVGLEAWLAESHQPCVLVCIDLSTSFAASVAPAIAALRSWATRENVRLLRRCVVFAATAGELELPLDFSTKALGAGVVLSAGTRLAPLLDTIAAFGSRRIAVLSDLEFDDGSREAAVAALGAGDRCVTVFDGRNG